MATVDTSKVISAGNKLEASLIDATTQEERDAVIYKYIDKIANSQDKVYVPDFKSGLEWLNTTQPLSLHNELRGKIVILDFFTYCCINCMHVLPDLEAIEEQYSVEDGVVVVGVHSAKFPNEKLSANILSAVLRYDISHAVVNDPEAILWQALQIQCWPTFVVVSPEGEVLLTLVGEGNREKLMDFIRIAVDCYKAKGALSGHSVPISPIKDSLPPTPLSFPGKISLDSSGDNLIISDSGHHQILITSKEGVVKECIGSSSGGFNDGNFEEARFHSPQGVVYHEDCIYVADTDNHAIRKIDLNNREVTTLVGTGVIGNDKEGGAIGKLQPISSPWDLVLGSSPGSDHIDILYIAMAGTHQIWVYFMDDANWLKGSHYKKGSCIRFAGSGNEENRNNSYPHKASFAQPSGLSMATEEKLNCLFVADSESSSIRTVFLKDGATRAVVGGAMDPMDLFAFGDVDGKGLDAKLQHPLAVAWNKHDEKLYVADSYNHKIKVVDPFLKTCTTLVGSGQAGLKDGCEPESIEFNEPSGLCLSPDGKLLYISDTNNNHIRTLDLETKQVNQLHIVMPVQPSETEVDASGSKKKKRLTPASTPVTRQDTVYVCPLSTIEVELDIELSADLALTPGAPTGWQLLLESDSASLLVPESQRVRGKINKLNQQPKIKLEVPELLSGSETSIKLECMLYFCEKTGNCHIRGVIFELPISIGEKTDDKAPCLEVKLHQEITLAQEQK
ncbi:NHL repeat-containing protein 2-like [Ptychodera flava]|uniref:NHL repeat-containing protein 2-like n=1 Tax=Ptychodera flava TaxID=63121 RepID=UPI003969BD01